MSTKLCLMRCGAVALALVGAAPVYADTASSTGGLRIKSDDGSFEASFGGRIHFDAVYLDPDNGAGFGSAQAENNSGSYFRRVFVQMDGRLYDWRYRLQYNIAGGTNSFMDVWVSHTLLAPQSTLYIGQKKPWRSLEELGANNNTLFMERPVTSASGIYGGRDFQQGLFYAYSTPDYFAGLSAYMLNKDGQAATQGSGATGRLVWSPLHAQGRVLHLGLSYASDHADNSAASTTAPLVASYRYAGYRLGSGTMTQTFAAYGAGVAASQATLGAELAAVYGPFYLNGEYARARFAQDGRADQRVSAAYLQASWFISGESKPYTLADHTIANPRPAQAGGALELKLRYERMRDEDAVAGTGCSTSKPPAAGIDQCRYSGWTTGLNYYMNPAMRMMLDYQQSDADLGSAGHDRPRTIAMRLQLVY